MSKKIVKIKPMSDTDRKVESYRQEVSRIDRYTSAREKAYQVFVDHGLSFKDVKHVMIDLENMIERAQQSAIIAK